MIVASAGRRVDAAGADSRRFPPENVPLVREAAASALSRLEATGVVTSAACGADLIVLDAARALAIPASIVLPFGSRSFRQTSVVDRPGDWGSLYDELIAAAETSGSLLTLNFDPHDAQAYMAANRVILERAAAAAAAPHPSVAARGIWDGRPRGEGDVTMAFRTEAERKGFAVHEISTLSGTARA
jgi:hypothetical protein